MNVKRTLELRCGDVWVITDNARVVDRVRRLGAHVWSPPPDDLLPTDAGGNDPAFRGGFWRASLRRFEVVAAFQETSGSPFVHVESDVVLLPGFDPSALRVFEDQLAYPLLQPGSGIGSIVYLGGPTASRTFASSIREERARRDERNDMLALGRFAEEHPELVSILPTVDPSWPAECCRDEEFRAAASANFGAIGGLVDGATLGQYLLGHDARNHRGRRILHHADPHHGIDATQLGFRMTDGTLLVGPKDEPVTARVLNLHVHSKDRRAFGLGSGERLLKQRCTAGTTTPRAELDPWGFVNQVGHSLRRRWSRVRNPVVEPVGSSQS